MPPNNTNIVAVGEDKDDAANEINFLQVGGFVAKDNTAENSVRQPESKRQPLIWTNIILIALFHFVAVYSLFKHTIYVKYQTVIWGFIIGGIGGFGITGGAHRLWSHRAYKAKLPLQLILLFCYSVAGQNSLFDWIRDHRVHHKFSETDADPHNSNRGFFFSHVGWLMQKKHPEVLRKGKLVDMSDITSDPLLMFHTKYWAYIKLVCCFILPVIIPVYGWNETWKYAIISQVFVRYVLNLNFTWSVNSVAHIWGSHPYDKRIKPTQNLGVAIVAMGEGWHNYHHVFPWDYKAAELGNYSVNTTTMWLDFFAKLGWAYDLKSPSKELIRKTVEKYGDNSHVPEIPDPNVQKSD